jgi:SAM-dependent methyltransferase
MSEIKNMGNNQNIYDNETFFEGYKELRKNPDCANNLEENPAIMSLCPDLIDKKVLDLGCGYGDNCRRFSELGAEKVVGIDISKKMLDITNRENKAENIKYYNIDMMRVDNFTEKFDVIFSSLAVHYIEDFKSLLVKVSFVLKNNGVFIFSQEHPLTTAPIKGASWTKDEKGNVLYYNLSDYCRNGKREVSWIVDGIIKYHRCFSEIINDLIDAGFTIERMLEPIPTKDVIKRLPSYEKDIDKPNFLIIKARKIPE